MSRIVSGRAVSCLLSAWCLAAGAHAQEGDAGAATAGEADTAEVADDAAATETETEAEDGKDAASEPSSAESTSAPPGASDEVAPATPDAPPADEEAAPAPTAAEPPVATAPPVDVHFGLNLRTDLGAHPIRLDVGARWEMIDVALVVDPMVFTDGLMSTDLLVMWRTPIGVQPIVGWRVNTIGVIDGPQVQENLLVGVGGDLPRLFGGWLRAQAGVELAATLVRHGGGLPTETIGFSSARSYLDLLNFALFVRGEIAIPIGGTW